MDDYSEEYGPADLGDVTIGKLIDKHDKAPQSKGLASLLKLGPQEIGPKIKATKKIETITTEMQNFDPMVLNEILRVVREKNHSMQQRFDLIEAQITHLTTPKGMEKKLAASLMTICLLMGIVVGSLWNGGTESKNTVSAVAQTEVEESIAPKMRVTTKFINLRVNHSPKAAKILTIAPAQEVQVISTKAGWAKVIYKDKLSGKEYQGHLWDEYLK